MIVMPFKPEHLEQLRDSQTQGHIAAALGDPAYIRELAQSEGWTAMEGDTAAYLPLRNAFELYGVDFLLDESWGVHLLEFNPTPDVRQTGARRNN